MRYSYGVAGIYEENKLLTIEQTIQELNNFDRLYIEINEMMAELGCQGEIDTRHPLVDRVMSALHDIDNGNMKLNSSR